MKWRGWFDFQPPKNGHGSTFFFTLEIYHSSFERSKRTELSIWGSHEFPGSASLLETIKDIDEDCGMPKGTEGRGGQYFAFFSNGSFMGGAVYFIFPRPDHWELVNTMYLLTEWKGRTGKYLARGHGVRTEGSEVRAPWPRAKYFTVRPDLTQSI